MQLQGKKFYYRWRQFMATIAQLQALQPDTECTACDIGPEGHQYDCPEAQE